MKSETAQTMTLHARDLLLFTAGSDEQRKRFATDLVDDYKRTGFAKVINHGIKDDVVEKLFALVCSSRLLSLIAPY
jgi:isopenicillin N synthase-like dioxygenase